MLQINMNLLYIIINLVVLYLLLKKFLIKPITDIMEKREKLIAEGLNHANVAQKEAMEIKQEYETALIGAKEESAVIVEKAQQQAKTEYQRIITEAGEKAGNMLESAKINIEMERNQTMNALQFEIAGLAMAAAGKIVGGEAKTQGNQEIYNQFLEEVGDVYEDTDKG